MSHFTPADLAAALSPWMIQLSTFVLVLSRVSGMLSVGPLLGRAILPWQARVGMALVLSLLLAPLVGWRSQSGFDLIRILPEIAIELGLGFLLGCGSLLILWAIPLAGRLLDQQLSFPSEEDDEPLGGSPIARWLTLWGAACFFLCSPINGHLQAVRILADSFQTWPLDSTNAIWEPNLMALLLQHSCQLALTLIAPALATLTLVNFGIGLLGAAGLPGVSTTIGHATRPIVAVVVLVTSMAGIQQGISNCVRDGITAVALESATSP